MHINLKINASLIVEVSSSMSVSESSEGLVKTHIAGHQPRVSDITVVGHKIFILPDSLRTTALKILILLSIGLHGFCTKGVPVLQVPEKSQQLCLNAPLQRIVKFSTRDTVESTEFHLPPDTPGLCHSATPLFPITNKTFMNINKDPQMYLSKGIF